MSGFQVNEKRKPETFLINLFLTSFPLFLSRFLSIFFFFQCPVQIVKMKPVHFIVFGFLLLIYLMHNGMLVLIFTMEQIMLTSISQTCLDRFFNLVILLIVQNTILLFHLVLTSFLARKYSLFSLLYFTFQQGHTTKTCY